jgi:predicted site-specific integrase-resolvase
MGTSDRHPKRGLDLGYARVSTTKQNLERQLASLNEAGIPADRIWVDTKTGASAACSRWGCCRSNSRSGSASPCR